MALEAQVRDALLNPDTGLFGARRLAIGESIFESEIMDACTNIPGVKAIHGVRFIDAHHTKGPRFDPGEGGYYYVLNEHSLWIVNGAQHAW